MEKMILPEDHDRCTRKQQISGKMFFLNENIITVKKDNILFLDDEDYHEVIVGTAKNVSLNVSAILELAHTRIGDVPYSLEAALLSSAHIRFHTGIDEFVCAHQV
jgi:hypothetical protein